MSPDLDFFSDTSDVGWGALLGNLDVSGKWSSEEKEMHINMKELKANFLGIQHFAMQVHKTTVVHADNTTALAYIKHQGGTHSFSLCEVVKNLLCWADLNQTRLVIRFIQGKCSVLADELSYHQQILPSEWTLEFSVCTSLWNYGVNQA